MPLGQGFAPFGNAAEQRVQRLVTLQGAQVFGVGAGDVDGHVVRMWVNAVQANQVVIDSLSNGRNSVFANVQTQNKRVALWAFPANGRFLDVR